MRGSGRFSPKDRLHGMGQVFQSPSLRGSGRFPRRRCVEVPPGPRVSIPFIAGQWSLPAEIARAEAEALEFQSPSLRGSGRFWGMTSTCPAKFFCFNPLHCGAVVASRHLRSGAVRAGSSFNPLHCGAVVASLLHSRFGWGVTGFNPLHCGAVVASG